MDWEEKVTVLLCTKWNLLFNSYCLSDESLHTICLNVSFLFVCYIFFFLLFCVEQFQIFPKCLGLNIRYKSNEIENDLGFYFAVLWVEKNSSYRQLSCSARSNWVCCKYIYIQLHMSSIYTNIFLLYKMLSGVCFSWCVTVFVFVFPCVQSISFVVFFAFFLSVVEFYSIHDIIVYIWFGSKLHRIVSIR